MGAMKTVILGAGRRGLRLAKYLSEEQNDVVIIDENPDAVNLAMNSADCIGYTGNGASIEDLRAAGIENADVFIALTGEDETNLVSCGIASGEFKIPKTIATVRNLSYTAKINQGNLMGISHIINPSVSVAGYIYSEIEHGIFSDIITSDDSSLVLYNVKVKKGSIFDKKLVKNIRKSVSGDYIIAAITGKGRTSVPSGDTLITADDCLSIVATDETLTDILRTVGKKQQNSKKIVVVGSTKITEYLLKEVPPSKLKKYTVIAKDPEACKVLASKFPEVLVINRNIAEHGTFEQEEIDNADLFLALTDNDELNILSASYAKSKGIKNAVALCNKNPDYVEMANHLAIDSIISAQNVTVESVLNCLYGNEVSNNRSILEGQIVTFEYLVSEDCPLCGKLLMDIDMRGKGVIAGATKANKTIIPGGKYKIENGDRLMVVAQKQDLGFVRDIFRIS